MHRLCGILIVTLLAILSIKAWVYDEDSYSGYFTDRVLDPIEGVWQFPDGGAILLIHKTSAYGFDILVLDSNRLDMRPMSKIGEVAMTAKKGHYEGYLSDKIPGKRHNLKSKNIVLTVNDDKYLCVKAYRTGFGLSFKRMLYRWFKITIVEYNERPNDLDGAIRIYPNTGPVVL